MIEVKDLRKNYNGQEVLKGINFKINKGDVVAILGPSGSGKTTILRSMNFLVEASGIINFEGKEYDLSKITAKEIKNIRQKTAFVFQNFNLFLNKTVLQNVLEGLVTVRKIDKQKALEIANEALKKVGMEEHVDKYPSQLSGGQQQRVAIARAIAYNPDIIYFDEPTSALDPELINEVLLIMKDLASSGITMLVVTHEMNFAKNVANRIIFLENGEIIEDASANEFFKNNQNERIKKFIKNISERV